MFECHITINLKDAEIGERVAKELHWKTSEIARDPVLGKDSYFYLTTHDNDLSRMISRMKQAREKLNSGFVFVVREKIEVIIHDVRYPT